MPRTWAIGDVDLHLDVDRTRVRGALERTLRDALRSGRLAPGTRLPSSRSLAQDLGLARNTVAAAYAQLVAEGWLEGRQGAGTRVALHHVSGSPAPSAPPPARAPQFDLRPGMPDLTTFPRDAWLAAARRALREAPFDALGYGDPRGCVELRRALAEYLARARGVAASPERIVVCTGLVQGLSLVRSALDTTSWAAEEYGHAAHRRGLGAMPVPVDRDGAVVSELGSVGAVLLTPAHQFPLGATLSPARRREVVAWSRSTGGVVVEDDYDGEFRYDRRPVGALQALAPEHVVYAGTASKSLAPGVRLGWLVVPGALLDAVLAARAHGDWPSALDQLTLAELIASGGYDRHVRRMRIAYRRRRDQLVSQVAHVRGIDAGLHAIVEVDDEQAVVERARRHDLVVEGLDSYRFGPNARGAALVIGYGTPPEHAWLGALGRLHEVVSDTKGV